MGRPFLEAGSLGGPIDSSHHNLRLRGKSQTLEGNLEQTSLSTKSRSGFEPVFSSVAAGVGWVNSATSLSDADETRLASPEPEEAFEGGVDVVVAIFLGGDELVGVAEH